MEESDARRAVIGQVLDYAAELGQASYETLNRSVATRLGKGGNALYDAVHSAFPAVKEEVFVDGVARSLKNGDFSFLLVGDGIREETERLGDYLRRHARLPFRFGLVEAAIYDLRDGTTIIFPRILMRPAESGHPFREVEGCRDHDVLASTVGDLFQHHEAPAEVAPSNHLASQADIDFWEFFRSRLPPDRLSRQFPETGSVGCRNVVLIPRAAWISVWRSEGKRVGKIGLVLRWKAERSDIQQALNARRVEILSALPDPADWTEDSLRLTREVAAVSDPEGWAEQANFLEMGLVGLMKEFDRSLAGQLVSAR